MSNIALDFQALTQVGSMLGSGAVVALAEGTCMLDAALNVVTFFRNESCGKCVPCRIGSQKLAGLGNHLLSRQITKQRWENELLPVIKDLNEVLSLTSICGLGRSVPVPLRTVVEFFPDDLNKHLAGNGKA